MLTKTRTKSVTNTQLAVATIALLVVGGAAFIMAPISKNGNFSLNKIFAIKAPADISIEQVYSSYNAANQWIFSFRLVNEDMAYKDDAGVIIKLSAEKKLANERTAEVETSKVNLTGPLDVGIDYTKFTTWVNNGDVYIRVLLPKPGATSTVINGGLKWEQFTGKEITSIKVSADFETESGFYDKDLKYNEENFIFPSRICYESDPRMDPYTKGKTDFFINGVVTVPVWDVCMNAGTLREYYCNDEKQITIKNFNCNCNDGSCRR